MPTSNRMITLLVGDTIALLIFAAIGRNSHGAAIGPAAFAQVFTTALPFLVGWLISAPLFGAYSPSTTANPLIMLRHTSIAWVAALLLGAVIRATMIGRFSPFSFYVVTFIVALFILCGWRALFAVWEERGSLGRR
ncbi:hypothetical protein OSCT_1720 [Oscillochloris trichoides DG-6]|uniref:DUF3054 domain-containing protein n=1 Tax=Oscillochloris trichoides DG-6 TaxID=765420 RepID=E1IEG9_9CHLR|nr:DUF3054 domain-containing protein [Oscillochloris trichoides]EFO80495.1 hypothetical protein OSCT_1720 [Oscillochloris trichoides DG-6]